MPRKKSKKQQAARATKTRITVTSCGAHAKDAKETSKRTCSLCREPAHEGDSEESFGSLAVLDPEALVFYDRDLASVVNVRGLCGPRFRQNSVGLYAHYGSPQGSHYVVYVWQSEAKLWEIIIDSVAA